MKCLPDVAALALLYGLVFFRRWRAKGWAALAVNTLMYVYLAFVLYFTLMPVLVKVPFIFDHPYKGMNMVPFVDVIAGRGDFIRQVALNIAMTVPFGFLFPLTREGRGRFGETVLFCFLMSLGIELLQPLISGSRTADITDIITNVTGGALGYVLFVVLRPVTDRLLGRRRRGR